MPRRQQRLDQQLVIRFRRRVGEIEAGQIDLAIPDGKQPEVGFELCPGVRRQCNPRPAGTTREAVLKLSTQCQACVPKSGDHLLRNTPRTAIAAGVTPGTRDACPSVSGRTWDNRCTISFDRPGTVPYGNAGGIRRRSSRLARCARADSCFRYPAYLTVVSTLAMSISCVTDVVSKGTRPL